MAAPSPPVTETVAQSPMVSERVKAYLATEQLAGMNRPYADEHADQGGTSRNHDQPADEQVSNIASADDRTIDFDESRNYAPVSIY